MSFDQRKSNNYEIDELNIKSHLNTSLDMEGISVSEDLINRTLLAIKNQSKEALAASDTVKKQERKVIPWLRYTRNIAVVAAAGLILIIGYNGLGRMGSKSDNAKMSGDRSSGYNMAAPEGTAAEGSIDQDNGSADMESALKVDESAPQLYKDGFDQKSTMDSAAKSGSSEAMMEEEVSFGVTTTNGMPSEPNAEGDSRFLMFREICKILPEAAETVAISEAAGGNIVVLNDREDIDRFFLQMESYTFTDSTGPAGEGDYTITISSRDESITVSVKYNMVKTESQAGDITEVKSYQVSAPDYLRQELGAWFE